MGLNRDYKSGHTIVATSGSASTLDMATTDYFTVTLTAACTLTFVNPRQGHAYYIRLAQDATGSRVVTWPASVKWASATAPTLTTTASKSDLVTLVYDATNAAFYGLVTVLNYT